MDVKDKVPDNNYPVHAALTSALSLGTILHGTIIHYQGTRCFIADNLFWLKGRSVEELDYQAKFTAMHELLKTDVDARMYLATQVLFSLPVYSYHPTSFDTIYKLYCVKCVQLNGPKVTNYQDRTAVWTVKPSEKCDTYELFNDQGVGQGLACVDSYDRSVKLNDLFRKIPENHRIDAIEESDDEAPSIFMDRALKMVCRWHPMHKQWVPLSVV